MKRWSHLSNPMLLLVTVMGLLFLGEVVLRLSYPQYRNYYGEMWRYSRELKIIVQEEPLYFEHEVNKSIRMYDTDISLNSDGLRDREYPLLKQEDVIRVAAVGDSTTLGWGVPLEDSYPKVLEALLNNGSDRTYEVMNFGVGNYNTYMESRTIEQRVVRFYPDIILLQYYINDLEGMHSHEAAGFRGTYLYQFLWQAYTGLQNRLGRYDGLSYYRNLYSQNNPYYGLNVQSLHSIISLAKAEGITLRIILIPELETFDADLSTLQKDFLLSIVPDERVILDLTPAFMGHDPPTLHISTEDMHLNVEGHHILAQGIYEGLAGTA